ncbi:protein C3orf33 homolog [Leptinotarsa decemlineata]|uniref:protein C3orf33 homolog n=1 Tax=Leptinotarsa decemlineata TaxID=7539 RepID=UPI003D30B75A
MMDKVSNAFHNFTTFMDNNTRGVQFGCYSVALVGLTVAVRKVRPFSKFKKPSDIPNHFLRERRELVGVVDRIEPHGTLLMIRHKPLINVPFISSGHLPIKISGINVSGLGCNWLQAVLSHEKVTFIPISKDKNYVQCQVLFTQKDKQQKEYIVNVGEKLVKIGFAVPELIEKPLLEDTLYMRYYKLLQKAEKHAQYKKLGLKYYIKPTKQAIFELYQLAFLLSRYSYSALNKGLSKIPKIYVS